ncbi:MAG: hypothetical protein ACRCU1_01870, partial [Alsobacter sp.]
MDAAASRDLTIMGRPVPQDLVGDLAETDDRSLAVQLEERGYLLLRDVLDPAEVMEARHEVLRRLAAVGEIADPPEAAIATGQSLRAEREPDLGAFWRSVSEGPALRRVANGGRMHGLLERLFGGPVAHFSFLWLRAMASGRA